MTKDKKNNKRKKITLLLTIIVLVFFAMIFCAKGENNFFKSISNSIGNLLLGPTTGSARVSYNFNYGWTFSKGEGKLNVGNTAGLAVTDYVDIPNPNADTPTTDIPYNNNYTAGNTWKNVSLPHTYNDEDTFNNFMETGLTGERSMYSGTAWYKKEFTIPIEYANKRIIIEFESARQAAKVWINGTLQTGTYENGFIAFGYDITDSLNPVGEENVITVMVDNSYPYYMEGTSSAVVWHDSHWHPNYGGLYRNSYLHIVDDLHLTLPLYSFTEGKGTYVYTSNETPTSATINVDAEVENSSNQAKTFTYRAIIKSMEGTTVLTLNGNATTIEAGAKQNLTLSGVLTNPIRWSTSYPYQYTVEMELYVDGNLVDNNENTFGVRTFRMTNDYGFYLNEHYTKLHGWGQKTTNEWAAIGAAYPDWMQGYVIKLMKEAGGNYIRWGHVAGSKAQIDMANKYGLLVLQPGVDGEGESSSGSSYDENNYRLRVESMRDMIIYFRNNPSIIMWEIGNQAEGLSKTASNTFLQNINWLNYNSASYSSNTYASVLYDVINKYDYGNRNTTITNAGSYANTSDKSDRLIAIRRGSSAIKDYVDVGETTEGSGGMQSSALGNKPAIEGEYNRLEVRRGVWDYSTTGFTNFQNTTTDAGYRNITNEEFAVQQVKKYSAVLTGTANVGGANWIFSDTISHGRLQSEVSRASGEVDATMLPKSSYYVNQVMWSDTPGVYIIGHWNYTLADANNGIDATSKNIYVVANNVSSVELFINGVSKGTGTLTDGYLYTFSNITYETGSISVVGKDQNGVTVANYSISTHGEPYELEITPTTGPDALYANGSDILILDVKLKDANGNVCTTYDGQLNNTLVNFSVNASDAGGLTATWLGGYNSSIPENTRANALYLEAGITRVFLRTTMNPGDITVTANMGSFSDSVTITSTSINNTNGLSTLKNKTANYSLDANQNSGVGSGDNTVVGETNVKFTSSLLVSDLSYTGSTNENNGIEDTLSKGIKIYSDNNATFTSVPYKFYNAELLQLPSIDNGLVAEDLLYFVTRRDVTVYILRDSTVADPAWLTEDYTLTSDTVTGSNGVTYQVWKRDVPAESSVTIGGNSDNGVSGSSGVMQAIFVKETSKVTNRTFFNENFDDFTEPFITYGWSSFVGSNSSITKETIDGRTGLRFFDNSADISFIQKSFATMTEPFTIEYKVYVTNLKENTWLRMWVSDGAPANYNDKTKLGIETYLFRDSVNNNFYFVAKDSEKTNRILGTGYSLNNWHTIKYVIDPVTLVTRNDSKLKMNIQNNRTYDVYIDDNLMYSKMEFAYKQYTNESGDTVPINKLNTITFGTGVSFLADYYIDDVIIKPIMDLGATSVTIDGNKIDLNKDTEVYLNLDQTAVADATFNLDTTDDYYNHTIERYNDYAVLTVENQNGDIYTCRINFVTSSILDSIIPHPNTDATIVGDIKDNNEVIHIYDTSPTNQAIIEKPFNRLTTGARVSFDIYLNNNASVNQSMIRLFLNDGAMDLTNANDYSKTTVHSYLSPQGSTNVENIMVRKLVNSATTDTYNDTEITKGEWHNLQYVVDFVNHKYSVYLDNNLTIEDYQVYDSSNAGADRLIIGSDTINMADFYIKNMTINEMTGVPIGGVTIDGIRLGDFDINSNAYTYYTDTYLTEDSIINLDTNAFYVSHTVVKDIVNQAVIINIVNNLGETITYTITYDSILNRPISKTDLETLVNEANSLNEQDYSYNTWESFSTALSSATILLLPESTAIQNDFSLAYHELSIAMDNLLQMFTYNDYETATVETIMYSANINDEFTFNKVLANNKQVYEDNTNNTFTSIPYKYMNAEYLLATNQKHLNALLTLNLLQDVDLLVLKDRNSGPLTVSGFTDTGEIATSSAGVVYKIYKKTYNKNNIINIEFNQLINNSLSGNNNIIAFIPSDLAGNDHFFYDTLNTYKTIYNDDNSVKYTSTDLFNRSWNNVASDTRSSATLVEDSDQNNYAWLLSESGGSSTTSWSMSWMYKEFATLNETVKFKYYVYVDSNKTANMGTTALDNQWVRTWLHQDTPGDYDPNGATASEKWAPIDSKNNTLMDMNININGNYLFRVRQSNSLTTNTDFGVKTQNNWVEVVITSNIKTHKYYVEVKYPSASEYTRYPSGATNYYNFYNGTSNNYANYVYFASRKQGLTNVRLKNIEVYPVDLDMYTSISVDGNDLSLYKDLTKSYLYKSSTAYINDGTNNSEPTVTTTSGTTLSNPTETKTNTTQSSPYQLYLNPNTSNSYVTYTDIDSSATNTATNTTYDRDYRIYYEVDSDKSLLTDKIIEAQAIKRTYYTTESYNNMLSVLEKAIIVVSDQMVDQTIIDQTYDELVTAIDNLSSIENFSYKSKIAPGHQYGSFAKNVTNITNKSSLTANFRLETRISGDSYPYVDQTHTRYLKTDLPLVTNTKITMIDNTTGSELYYYIVTSADYNENKTSYALNDFIKIGTTNEHYNYSYNYNSTTKTFYDEVTFIVDYQNVLVDVPTGNHTLSFELYANDNLIVSSDNVNYTIYNATIPVSMSAELEKESNHPNENVALNTSIEISNILENNIIVNDTTHHNKKLGIRLSLYDNANNLIEFPKGTTITNNGTVFNLENDGVFRIFGNNSFESFSKSLIITPGYQKIMPGRYKIKVEFIETSDGYNNGNVITYSYTDLTIEESPNCSISANVLDNYYVMNNNDFDTLNFSIHTVCNYVTDDQIITISLSKKDNAVFNNFNYTVIDYFSKVNNSAATLYDTNIYKIKTHNGTNSVRTDYTDNYAIDLKPTELTGSYKLKFDVRAGSIVESDDLSFQLK